jgi:hypothetical protein
MVRALPHRRGRVNDGQWEVRHVGGGRWAVGSGRWAVGGASVVVHATRPQRGKCGLLDQIRARHHLAVHGLAGVHGHWALQRELLLLSDEAWRVRAGTETQPRDVSRGAVALAECEQLGAARFGWA